ncbi:MAG TPA: hypothetical protein PKD76_05800 [Solirubrobacterales bacterium]|nr:hypothetical protein [Solirubrobacterales bacterium]
MSEVTHANALRGAEFRKLLGKPKTWIVIVICSLVMAACGLIIGPVFALGLFVVTFLVGIAITFSMADSRAAQGFYEAYADYRGLTLWPGGKSLGGETPLLRKGDKQRVEAMFEGMLSPEIEGKLALFTFIVESRDSKGNKTEVNYPFTIVLFNLPEAIQSLRELRVQRKSGFKALEKFEDTFRRDHERVTLESEAMRDRYEIFVGKQEDPVFVRRLFSPSFIVWLTESPPEKFAFELENGWLCAYVPKHRDSIEEFDEIIEVGTIVTARIKEEILQTSPDTEGERS